MERVWTLFLLGAGIVLLALGIVLAPKNPWLLLLLLPGAAALYSSIKRDSRWEKQVREQRELKAREQIREVTAPPWREDEVMVVKGYSHLWAIAFGFTALPIFLGGIPTPITDVLLRLLALLFLYLWLVTRGKPRLELDSSGFSTPFHGHIPWSAVNSVALQTIGTSGGTNFLLQFHLDDYAKAVATIPWLIRVMSYFGLRPRYVGVYLGNDGKEPEQEIVYGVARYLWQQSRLQRNSQ